MKKIIIIIMLILVSAVVYAKLSDMTRTTSIDPNDLLYIVHDPCGTPASRAIKTEYFINEVFGMVLNCAVQKTIIDPNGLDSDTRDAYPLWRNYTSDTFVITNISASADINNVDLIIKETDPNGANIVTVDSIAISTSGTGFYYTTETSITAASIGTGNRLIADFNDVDDPNWVELTITGYFDTY